MGCSKGAKGYIFYSGVDKKTFISMNAQFLEEDYIRSMKPRSKLVLEELLGESISTSQLGIVPKPVIEEPHKEPIPAVP